MGLIDDDGVVLIEEAVALHLGEQDAVGHELDGGGLRDAVIEADGVADGLADFLVQFRGDAFGHGACCNTARLGMADKSAPAAAQLEADLRDLGGLTRTGLTSDDDDLVVPNCLGDIILAGGDGEVVGVGDGGDGGVGKCDALGRGMDLSADFLQRFRGASLLEAATEGAGLGQSDIFECGEELVARRGFVLSHD